MALPDIDFDKIRILGNQANAFEELCCQLAEDERSPTRLRFDRKGPGGDGGVECFETLANGDEIGWQVKYYTDFSSMLASLGGSLDKALRTHPAMGKFIACFPFDLSDARKEDTKSALAKWNEWSAKKVAEAASKGRTIEIDRWDKFQLRRRLTDSNPKAAGLIAYWFDQELLTPTWCQEQYDRTRADLGKRYDPEFHVNVPARRSIMALARDVSFFHELGRHATRIESLAADRSIRGTAAGDVCVQTVGVLRSASDPRLEFDVDAVRKALDQALGTTITRLREILATEDKDKSTDAVSAHSRLADSLRTILAELSTQPWDLIERHSLLVFGHAGQGKSHLLADACAHQLAAERPAIMVLGGKLVGGEPWSDLITGLDLPKHLQKKHFLGALNAAGQACGARALVLVDALNEKNGQDIWPDHLAGFLRDAQEFPWVAVVVSCRSSNLELIIPEQLDEAALPRLEHVGFTPTQVRTYLKHRGITLPEAPLQARELQTPLFLRTVCEALAFEGQTLLASGLSSLTNVLDAYIAAVCNQVHRKMRLAPNRKPALKAIEALAREMLSAGRAEIPYDTAESLIIAIHAGRTVDEDLLFQLESAGLLATDTMIIRPAGGLGKVVRFTFERIGDHAMARWLLDQSDPALGVKMGGTGTALHDVLHASGSRLIPTLLESLAIQLPERFGIELPDLEGLVQNDALDRAFRKSLCSRRPAALTTRTWELVDLIGGARLRYDTLIALATESDHSFNALHLDKELRAQNMPERDSVWSAHVALENATALQLIEWALHADQTAISPERARLATIQMCWFFTTSNRTIRDRATKALVVLLSDRWSLARELWTMFRFVDDGYVIERLMAALYGAALQGSWQGEELQAAAVMVHADVFEGGSPLTNALFRDHAAGLVRLADHRGALPADFDLASTQPPYSSSWPIDYVTDQALAHFDLSTHDGTRYRDQITASCDDGDFARYVLDISARQWSPARRGTNPLPTDADLAAEWFQDFNATAKAEQRSAYQTLANEIASFAATPKDGGQEHIAARDNLRAAEQDFAEAVGPDKFAEWRARAENWRTRGMYQFGGARNVAGFNLAWARRWVNWRAHELGWSQQLHGGFDNRQRNVRHSHSIERIGKKYQWLAFYELVARMEDNLAPIPGIHEDGPSRLRNLDPSMLRQHAGPDADDEDDFDGDEGDIPQTGFWVSPEPVVEGRTAAEMVAWLRSSDDIIDGAENIEVTSPDGRPWLVCTGFEMWRGGPSAAPAETWRRIGCVLVKSEDFSRLLQLLTGQLLTEDHALPIDEGERFHVHLGEHPWAWPVANGHSASSDGWLRNWRPNGGDWSLPGIDVLPVAGEYLSESGSFDYSIDRNVELALPAGWLMERLGLQLSDGLAITYEDQGGSVLFKDPSVDGAGRSAALIDRSAFFSLLEEDGLIAVWAIGGEKSVFGPTHSNGFGGRLSFTRIFHTQGDQVMALERYSNFEKPSRRQLAILLGECIDIDDGDDDDDDDLGAGEDSESGDG